MATAVVWLERCIVKNVCVCVCGKYVRSYWNVCSVFNVNICYLTKLKLASGNAYNCNDRSGINLKGRDVFF